MKFENIHAELCRLDICPSVDYWPFIDTSIYKLTRLVIIKKLSIYGSLEQVLGGWNQLGIREEMLESGNFSSSWIMNSTVKRVIFESILFWQIGKICQNKTRQTTTLYSLYSWIHVFNSWSDSFKVVLILVYFHFIVDIIIACMYVLQPAETIKPSVSAHDLLGLVTSTAKFYSNYYCTNWSYLLCLQTKLIK